MSLDSEIWIREFMIDIVMGFHPKELSSKARGSKIDKDS